MRIDLHCHTTASDGRLSPSELVERAAQSDVDVIAVSDHDTVAGVEEAQRAGTRLDVTVISSIELSARLGGRNVHVLGPFIDHRSTRLRDVLDGLRADRIRRAGGMVERLRGLGYDISMADVAEQATGAVVARPHVARVLVAKGYIEHVSDAFTAELIADGGAADVAKRTLAPVEAVELIVECGGVPVVAHPGVGHHGGIAQPMQVELLAAMRDAGMVGLEVDHPDHDPLMRERLTMVAADLGLVVTGGSDFHGDEGHVLCRCSTTPESLEVLRASTRAR